MSDEYASADVDHDVVEGAATVAAFTGRYDKWFNRTWRICRKIPMFAYLLVVFIIIQLSVADVRSTLFDFGGYRLTWVEVLYVAGASVGMAELLKVSKPGINNAVDALFMLGVGTVCCILFVLGAVKTERFEIFSNTEFLILTYFSLGQGVLATLINARTLKRTIDHSTHGGIFD